MPKARKLRPLADVVNHILGALGEVESYTSGMTLPDFEKDLRTVRAVERCLEIISEASRDVPPAVKAEHPQINWRAMADAGNLYRHGYEFVKVATLWRTVEIDIAPLKQAMLAIKSKHVDGAASGTP